MKEKINNLLKHPIRKIYFLSIIAVYLMIAISSFSISFYNFLAYGQEIKEINTQIGYTLTYDNQGGTGCTNQIQYRNKAWGTLCTPTKEGDTFEGWFTEPNGEGEEVTSSTLATTNKTVYAFYPPKTLYYVLKNAAKEGTYARKYTGEHQDSMDSTKSTKDIYHWYGSNDANGTAILDKNNVIFANHCWQMIRTTDTGGVRMIYNGEVVDGKCLNTRGNHVGYSGSSTSQDLNGPYWYGTDYIYENGVFTLSGTKTFVEVPNDYNTAPGIVENIAGKYTCKSGSELGTCSILYLVDRYDDYSYVYTISLTPNQHYSQFGTLPFEETYVLPMFTGYMYNKMYGYGSTSYVFESMLSTLSLSTTYYYADSYDYNETNANKYTLTNPYQVSSTGDYSSLVGKYTFRNTSSTYSNTRIYYIVAVDDIVMYYIQLSNGNDLAYYNDTYTYGSSYTDNGNGTYTISNPTTINKTEYYNNYNNMKNKYVCKNATNNTCGDVWRTTSNVSTTIIEHLKSSNAYKCASGFVYDSNTNKYVLNDDTVTFWDRWNSDSVASLSTHHYTCLNATGECTNNSIFYIYQVASGYLRYIVIPNGENIEMALTNMLSANNINTKDSTIKQWIEAWYKKNLLNYDGYIDDTIYCNDRSIKSLGAWKPDGGSVTSNSVSYLKFKEYDATSDLSCSNITDRFSVTNNSARLTYKVGLMTLPEMNLLNNGNARKTTQNYWLLSPSFFASSAYDHYIDSNGSWNNSVVNNRQGVRPAISLVPGLEYSSGDGSMANPYVVDTN